MAYQPLISYLSLLAIAAFVWLLVLLPTHTLSPLSLLRSFSGHWPLTVFIAGSLLVLTLVAQNRAIRALVELNKKDYQAWLYLRSTRATFGFIIPLHDRLRLRFAAYRWWHIRPYAGFINSLAAIVVITLIGLRVVGSVAPLIVSSDPVIPDFPPSVAPIMNDPTNITTSSIQWNWSDQSTDETSFHLQDNSNADITIVNSTTQATTGTIYSFTETNLTPDAGFTRHAVASNTFGNSPNSNSKTTRTLANVPGAPSVISPTTNSLTVTVNQNSNPSSTEYAIQETTTGKYLQSSGTLDAGTVWQTYASWGGSSGKVASGLTANTNYTFQEKARNGNQIETGFSSSNSRVTLAYTPVAPSLTVKSTTSINVLVNENNNLANVEFAIFNNTLGKYVTPSGLVQSAAFWATKATFGGTGGVTNTGLIAATSYTYTVKARNADHIETPFSPSSTANTGSPPGTTSGPPPGTKTPTPSSDPGLPASPTTGTPPTATTIPTIILTITLTDVTTGAYSVPVQQTINGQHLDGVITGTGLGGKISGEYSGLLDNVPATGSFVGTTAGGKITSGQITFHRPSDPTFTQDALVAGTITSKTVATRARMLGGLAGFLGLLGLGLGLLSNPTISSNVITNILSGWNFFGYAPGRKKPYWGQVLDSKTKSPIPGVTVELSDTASGKLLRKMMTDRTGRYGFLVEKAGSYQLKVRNPLYNDFQSQAVTISDPANQVVSQDILLTANGVAVQKRIVSVSKLIRFLRFVSYFHWPLLIGGSIIAVIAYLQIATTTHVLILVLYALLWLLEALRLGKERPYGTVSDANAHQQLPLSVVQLTKLNGGIKSVAASTVTDSRGRFLFVVKPGEYNMIAAHDGFTPAEMKVVRENPNLEIGLQRATSTN